VTESAYFQKNQFNNEARDDIHDNFCDQTPKHPHPPLHEQNCNCFLKPTSQTFIELLLNLPLVFYSASIKELLSHCYILLASLENLELVCPENNLEGFSRVPFP
jgi:hypothetical protein